jgi:hypothetical protein
VGVWKISHVRTCCGDSKKQVLYIILVVATLFKLLRRGSVLMSHILLLASLLRHLFVTFSSCLLKSNCSGNMCGPAARCIVK